MFSVTQWRLCGSLCWHWVSQLCAEDISKENYRQFSRTAVIVLIRSHLPCHRHRRMGTYRVLCSLLLLRHITAASRCLNLQHLRYKRDDIPVATKRTVRWYWHHQWIVVLRRYRATCLEEGATQFVFCAQAAVCGRPVDSSKTFLAVWTSLLPRRQCAACTDTRGTALLCFSGYKFRLATWLIIRLCKTVVSVNRNCWNIVCALRDTAIVFVVSCV